MKKTGLLTMLISTLFTTPLLAAGPGTTNANFLKAGQGVRPVAMGETYAALGDGLDTLYWNPAGLSQLENPTVSFSHNFWLEDIGTEYLAYGTPLGIFGAVGGGISVMHAGTIPRTLEDEFGQYNGVDGEASAMSIAAVGNYSLKLSRLIPTQDPFFSNVLVGVGLRIVSETIADTSIFGGGIDLGALWRQTETLSAAPDKSGNDGKPEIRDNGWRLGLTAQNLGMTSDKLLPIGFRAGAGYVSQKFLSPQGRGTLALDALVPIDNQLKISLGAEYAHISQNTEFAVRAGYKIGNEIQDLDAFSGFTVGAGFAIAASGLQYRVDYAFVPYGDLGITHRLALSLAFVPSEPLYPELVNLPAEAPKSERRPAATAAPKPAASEVKSVPAFVSSSIPASTPTSVPTPSSTPVKTATSALKEALRTWGNQIQAGILPALVFEKGKDAIPGGVQRTLDALGKALERNPEGAVKIIGFAGKDGKLAEARAKAAARYLTMSFSIDPDRLATASGDPAKQAKNSELTVETGN